MRSISIMEQDSEILLFPCSLMTFFSTDWLLQTLREIGKSGVAPVITL